MKRLVFCLFLLIASLSVAFLGCNNSNTKTDTLKIDPLNSTLRLEAEKQKVLVGAAIEPQHLDEAKYADVLKKEFNFITPENRMKWGFIHPTQDTYDYIGADKIVNFAIENKMKIRGHALVWHIENPKWLTSKTDWKKDELLSVLQDHIKNVVGHYKGKVAVWDVINEGVSDTASAYRENLWYNTCGPEYIEKAFIWAHEADPDAKLYFNDYGNEETNRKSDFLYNLVKDLKAKNIPIDGIGMQFHMDLDSPLNLSSVYQNIKRFVDLGILVDFTEIDVRINGEVTPDRLKKQAKVYSDLMEILLSFDKTKAFTTWGFTDKYSWIDSFYKGSSGGLTFDKDYAKKPAYDEILKRLKVEPGKTDFKTKLDAIEKSRNVIPSFVCMPTEIVPTIDGIVKKNEWKDGIQYRLGYNQLDISDQRLPRDVTEAGADWTLLYNKNKLYGMVNVTDDIIYTDNSDDYNNDCIELFMDTEAGFTQFRTLVGKDWQPLVLEGARKAKWSKNGKILEFMIELNENDLKGLTIGWNIALNDNDGGAARERQIYPVPGTNNCWKGIELANLKFEGDTPRPVTKVHMIPPFSARQVTVTPTADGVEKELEYFGTLKYSFAYNKLNAKDQRPPDRTDLYGEWNMMFEKNKIHGFLIREDDKTVTDKADKTKNDGVEISFKLDEKIYKLHTTVGGDFDINELGDKAKAVWNTNGRILEYTIELPTDTLLDKMIGFTIELCDNDGGDDLKYKLSPIPGVETTNGVSLADLKFEVL